MDRNIGGQFAPGNMNMDWLEDYDKTTQAAAIGSEIMETGTDIHDLDRLDTSNHDCVSV